MTREDIKHLMEVCESVAAQIKASDKQAMTMDDFDAFLGRMLWAIHASKGNPRFSENKFRDFARNGTGNEKDVFHD